MANKQHKTSKNGKEDVSKLVVPLTSAPGEKHLLEKMFEEKEIPILKAVGYAQLRPGDAWVSYVMTTQGDKVLSIVVAEPNLRLIAEEAAKTDFVTEFMDKGL